MKAKRRYPALSMPLTERRMRYEAMIGKLRSGSIQQWFADFIEALGDSQSERTSIATLEESPSLWPLRTAGTSPVRLH